MGLPQGYTFRKLQVSDYSNNYIETLKVLTTVGEVSQARFEELFAHWDSLPQLYQPHVITNEQGVVVATGMLLVEKKMIHECGLVGHIEDIAIATSEQGKKLGYTMITNLTQIAEAAGCYKVILDCSTHNIGFYEKCGYTNGGTQMVKRA
ncbi:acyl-CoA N-acyltransferase [Suhomyces tanzawaensis NRRL Y-17324]|uniref:Glucosamine 6-phosphate N-acetyltransferase n=1 Tax=Suhomyces tanzawaensis NRRL Y-17324 TaxID=984487 RepID=A0A1E4SCR9_9ASCO|nr:acyl-CoA N-acyltransferase [Suhomyces tanzawaensis NRRL Y-17324]ODV77258.1 acyl-CoA N-acyltransferase [Suhomyces tanzawaensis NRRL Y-17324]